MRGFVTLLCVLALVLCCTLPADAGLLCHRCSACAAPAVAPCAPAQQVAPPPPVVTPAPPVCGPVTKCPACSPTVCVPVTVEVKEHPVAKAVGKVATKTVEAVMHPLKRLRTRLHAGGCSGGACTR